MSYALIFCLIGCIGSLSCFLLPKEELDYYVDYYNMDNREQNGSNCSIYFGSIPEIRWKDYTGFTGYQLQVSQDEKFSTLLVNEENLTTASCQLNTPIKTAGSYYYRTKYKTPDNTWSQWGNPVKITLYVDTLQDDFEVLPDSDTAPIPWVVDGKVKLNTSYKKTGTSSLELITDKNQKSSSLATEVYCAGATRFSFWHYYNIIIIIDGTSKNENVYSWELFNITLTPGYHTIKLKTEDFIGGYFSSFTNSLYLDNLQFSCYGEKADNFFSKIETVLTGYELTGTTLPVFKEETEDGVYLEMGRGDRDADTTLAMNMNCAQAGLFSFSYLLNKGVSSCGTFNISINSTNYSGLSSSMTDWEDFNIPLAAGTNTITLNFQKNYDDENAVALIRNLQFDNGIMYATFFNNINTSLTSISYSNTPVVKFTEKSGTGLCLEMGQGFGNADTSLTLKITPSASCCLSILYLVNYSQSSGGRFSVSCNSVSYYNSSTVMSEWNVLVLPLVAGENTITIRYYKYYDYKAAMAAVRGFKFTSLLNGFESGTLNNPPWSTSGTLPVTIQSTYKSEGLNAVRIGSSTTSTTGSGTLQLALTVTEEAVISFDFMIGSYTSDDFVFYIDNTQIQKWDYISSYQWSTYGNVLSSGSHTLKWTMNDSSSSYAYYAYIDNLQISTTNYTTP